MCCMIGYVCVRVCVVYVLYDSVHVCVRERVCMYCVIRYMCVRERVCA